MKPTTQLDQLQIMGIKQMMIDEGHYDKLQYLVDKPKTFTNFWGPVIFFFVVVLLGFAGVASTWF